MGRKRENKTKKAISQEFYCILQTTAESLGDKKPKTKTRLGTMYASKDAIFSRPLLPAASYNRTSSSLSCFGRLPTLRSEGEEKTEQDHLHRCQDAPLPPPPSPFRLLLLSSLSGDEGETNELFFLAAASFLLRPGGRRRMDMRKRIRTLKK